MKISLDIVGQHQLTLLSLWTNNTYLMDHHERVWRITSGHDASLPHGEWRRRWDEDGADHASQPAVARFLPVVLSAVSGPGLPVPVPTTKPSARAVAPQRLERITSVRSGTRHVRPSGVAFDPDANPAQLGGHETGRQASDSDVGLLLLLSRARQVVLGC